MGIGLSYSGREVAIEARRSIFWRIVVAAIGLSLALLFALWWLTHQTVQTTLQEASRVEVDTDIAGLVDIYASNGADELKQRIVDRVSLTPVEGNTPHYLLADNNGAVLAGDLAVWPNLDPMVSESGYIKIGENSQGFARAVQLGPDLRLLVARKNDINAPILRSISIAFAAGGAVFLVLVALLGRVAALQLQRRIERINCAFRDPDGSSALAIAQPYEGDEIDELTAHSAAALTRVRDLMKAYKDISDQLAHEIRTPLGHLDNRLVKALKEQPEPEIAKRLVEARGDIRHVVQTLESLLDIAASKANKGDRAGLIQVDLSKVVTQICELYAGSAEETGHDFSWDIKAGITVEGDQRQLSRLVTNLLDNALKYVPAGGRIEVTLSPGPQLVIADDGPGVKKADQLRIFDRFYRGTNPEEEAPGSGLGLALARAIAERHGMQLTLDKSVQGAVFRMEPA